MLTLPRLYKKDQHGNMMIWDISVSAEGDSGVIKISFGREDGAIQTTTDTVSKGKNEGRANATTALEQAQAEAKSKWEKQSGMKGYIEDRAKAEKGENNRAGYEPMLAKPYDKEQKKVKFPVLVQPKLDGMRCLALFLPETKTVELFSRNGKPIVAVPHLNEQLALFMGHCGFEILDGELYNHEMRHDFEGLMSIVRKNKEIDKDKVMQYHIYDCPHDSQNFAERHASLLNAFEEAPLPGLVLVNTVLAESHEKVLSIDSENIMNGFEGSMVRNPLSLYQNKRTSDLLKVKMFLEEEFEILGMEEGRGKLQGHVGSFICAIPGSENQVTFSVKMEGKMSRLAELFQDPSLFLGKKLTVRYQNLTNEGIPRFPVGKAIRDYE